MQEAQRAAALDHPNICTVFEVDGHEGQTLAAMVYIDGPSLKEKIKAGEEERSIVPFMKRVWMFVYSGR